MTHLRLHSPATRRPRKAFTLVELLIVIAIIGLLAAILFPAFRRAQESGAQANCASNLQQIYQAVELYRQDEKYYPGSLGTLLATDYALEGGTNGSGTGFFKGGRDALTCKNDDTDSAGVVRSSYGDLSANMVPPEDTGDMGRLVWNYWGYRPTTTDPDQCKDGNVSECAGTAYQTSDVAATAATSNLLVDPSGTYDRRSNPVKYSLSNRFSPTSTIITHCVYHRIPTSSGKMAGPFDLETAEGALARDLILRRDGSARALDVSAFHTNNNWSQQNW